MPINMADVNSRKREKVLWVLTVAVVFLWIWTQFVLRPIFNYGNQLDADLAAKNLKLREAKKILTGTPQQLAAKESLRRFLPEGQGSTQEDMTRMIKDIESAASASGLKVIETKPQPQVKNVGWFELKVSISFEGRWSDVVQFLYQLDSVDKPLLVNEMSLESNVPQQTSIHGRLEIGRLFAIPSQDL